MALRVVRPQARPDPGLVRQRGRKFQAGLNVGLGKDDTLFAKIGGKVKFEDHGARGRFISVHPTEQN